MSDSSYEYDLVIIGSGPAGEKAAIHAAFYGKRVAILEKSSYLGGAGTNTGTLPSKTLKETAIFLSGISERGLYRQEKHLTSTPNADDFLFRERFVVNRQRNREKFSLLHEKVDIIHGTASFLDDHTLLVVSELQQRKITAEFILIATGSCPVHPPGIAFDSEHIHDSDSILNINRIPKSICIVGAGVIGCEYTTTFAVMGTKVILLNGNNPLLGFLDREIVDYFTFILEIAGVQLRSNVHVHQAKLTADNTAVRTIIDNEDFIETDMLLYTAGRQGNTAGLALESIGITPDQRGLIKVDKQYRTEIPHIFAAGDVIGFPALGSTSMDQGRVAVTHMFNLQAYEQIARTIPYGIYTIPEISAVGLNEEEAKEKNIPYIVSKAAYQDIPRGTIIGANEGFLKLIIHKESKVILGVHIYGRHATELIHYGIELVENKSTLQHIISTIFNFPTLHELYKLAAYNAWQQHCS